jgi:arylsulfatase A-like enzyme
VQNAFPSLRLGHENASETTDRAIEMLQETSGGTFFLWVHYLDPHWTYWAPEPYRSAADTEPGAPFTLYDDVRSGRLPIGKMIHHNEMAAPELERVRSLYAGEVAYVDAEVGRLVDAALVGPRAGSTYIVFTSDHGESVGEQGYFFSHGDLVNEASIRVPMIIRPPGGAVRRSVATPASLVDLAPTLLELAGASIPSKVQGTSLARLMTPSEAGESAARPHPIFGESDLSYLSENPLPTIPGEAGKLRFIRTGPYKLVRVPRDHAAARRLDPALGSASAGRRNSLGFEEATRLGPSAPDLVSLYDLSTDPGETRDLSAEEPERLAAMLHALDGWLSAFSGLPGSERTGSQELLDGLRSLGYVDPGGGGS